MAVLIKNKKVLFNYEMLEKFEAGIKLFGFEVKSLKNKRGSLGGSYVSVRNGEAFVLNFDVPPYQPANTPSGYDSRRERKLLLTQKEIKRLVGLEQQKGLTIVPISVYTKNNKIKIELVLVRGKKKHDKRETLKKRDTERDMRRELKER
jgi:SsrA-binding protein